MRGEQRRCRAQALVVAGLAGDVREQAAEVAVDPAQPLACGGVAEQRGPYRERERFGVASVGAIPTAGRGGASSGEAFSASSVRAWSAVARVSESVFTQRPRAPSPHVRGNPFDSVNSLVWWLLLSPPLCLSPWCSTWKPATRTMR